MRTSAVDMLGSSRKSKSSIRAADASAEKIFPPACFQYSNLYGRGKGASTGSTYELQKKPNIPAAAYLRCSSEWRGLPYHNADTYMHVSPTTTQPMRAPYWTKKHHQGTAIPTDLSRGWCLYKYSNRTRPQHYWHPPIRPKVGLRPDLPASRAQKTLDNPTTLRRQSEHTGRQSEHTGRQNERSGRQNEHAGRPHCAPSRYAEGSARFLLDERCCAATNATRLRGRAAAPPCTRATQRRLIRPAWMSRVPLRLRAVSPSR
eukprot:IDg14483t1